MDLHSVSFVVWKEFEARVCAFASCCYDLNTVPEWQTSEFRVNRVWMECWSSMQCTAHGNLGDITLYVFVKKFGDALDECKV